MKKYEDMYDGLVILIDLINSSRAWINHVKRLKRIIESISNLL